MLHRGTDSLGHQEHYLPQETSVAAASACAGVLGRAKLKFHERAKIASAKAANSKCELGQNQNRDQEW